MTTTPDFEAAMSSLSLESCEEAVTKQLEVHAEIESLLLKLLRVQLRGMGLMAQPSNAQWIGQWSERVQLPKLYTRWLEESLAMLAAGFQAGSVAEAAAWEEWEQQRDEWSMKGLESRVKLLERTLPALPDILRGAEPALDVLFPGGSSELVEGLYKDDSKSKFFTEALAQSLERYITWRIDRDPQSRLRILEVGAGTGGTTESVLKKLSKYAQHIDEYCYTDISRAFLSHAQQCYAPRAPYLRCRLLDVEVELQHQGWSNGGYDVVIAANVLHATKQIASAIRVVRATMNSGGLLLLDEITAKAAYTHLTFGLLEGWWKYEDAALRISGAPMLAAPTWERVLRAEGFDRVHFVVPHQGSRFGEQVIVARAGTA